MANGKESGPDVSVDDRQTAVPVDKAKIERLAAYTLRSEGRGDAGELAVTFVPLDEIVELNRRFRGKEGPTDVLSFSLSEGNDFVSPVPLLGNVIICPEVAAENAEAGNRSIAEEIETLTAHGILHLLGYSHSKPREEAEMFGRQKELVEGFRREDGQVT